MNLRNNLSLIFILFAFTSATAQNLNKIWDKRFGGDVTDIMIHAVPTSDGGFLLGGLSDSGISGDITAASYGDLDYLLIKINSAGTKVWDKRYGGDQFDQLFRILPTSDGGFILAGTSGSGISGDKTQSSRGLTDYWIVKVNSNGVKQWDAVYGGDQEDQLFSILPSSDGGYLLFGSSASGVSGEKTSAAKGLFDFWVVKITSTGVKQWDASFGGSGNEQGFGATVTSDGGYLLSGFSDSGVSGDKSQAGFGMEDYWIVKINSTGQKQWDAAFGGTDTEHLYSVVQAADGGFVLAGSSRSGIGGNKTTSSKGATDFWLVKTNSAGVKQWEQVYGGDSDEEAFSVLPASDGGFYIGGFTYSDLSGDISSPTYGDIDYWVVKANSAGVKQLEKRFGGNKQDQLLYIADTPDGNILLCGLSESDVSGDVSDPGRGWSDFWVLKASLSTSSASSIQTGNIPASVCQNAALSVPFSATGSYNTGNVFTAQLSNASGSFASPQVIGTLNGTTSGVISATVPASTPAGTGYRIRVVSSSPAVTGSDNGTNIQISSGTVPVITVAGMTLTSSPAASYQWILDGSPISGATAQSYTATAYGNYQVEVTYSNGCSILSAIKTLSGQPVTNCQPGSTYSFSLVKDIMSTWSSSAPRCMYKLADNKIFFFAKDPATNADGLYFSDGTSAGTSLLVAKLLPEVFDPEYSSKFCTFQGKLCFVGKLNGGNSQIYISDGTASGTSALTSFSSSLNISQLTSFDQKLFFRVYGGGSGALYYSTGASSSPTSFFNLPFADYQSTLHVDNNKLYVVTGSKVHDITNTSSPVMLYDHYVDFNGCISARAIINGKLIYQDNRNCTAAGPEYGDLIEVDLSGGGWRSLSSTVLFSNPQDYFRKAALFQNAIYFYHNPYFANEVNDEAQIYKYDGNSLELLHSHVEDSAEISFYGFHQGYGKLYFSLSVVSDKANMNPGGWGVLKQTDGTAANTRKVFDKTATNYYNVSLSVNDHAIFPDRIYFYADSIAPSWVSVKSTLFYDDGANPFKVLPNPTHTRFNANEMISLNSGALLISAVMYPSSGTSLGAEPWVYKCNNTAGMSDSEKDLNLAIYPNPTTGHISIYNPASEKVRSLKLYDQQGRLVVLEVKNESDIDLSSFSDGMYVLEIYTENGVSRQKIILNR